MQNVDILPYNNSLGLIPTKLCFTKNDSCFEYSENPEKLEKILNELEITVRLINTAESKHMPGSQNNIYDIEVSRESSEILHIYSFHYTDSINNHDICKKNPEGDEIAKDFLYSILCCIRNEYGIHENYPTYEDFCSEFGYDEPYCFETGVQNHGYLYESCVDHSQELAQLFTWEEIKYFPG